MVLMAITVTIILNLIFIVKEGQTIHPKSQFPGQLELIPAINKRTREKFVGQKDGERCKFFYDFVQTIVSYLAKTGIIVSQLLVF